MDDLKAYSEDEKQAENYQEDFSKWMNFVKAEVDSYDLYENTVKLRILLAAFTLVSLWLTIIFGIHDLLGYMWLMMSLVFAFGFFAVFYKQCDFDGKRIRLVW